MTCRHSTLKTRDGCIDRDLHIDFNFPSARMNRGLHAPLRLATWGSTQTSPLGRCDGCLLALRTWICSPLYIAWLGSCEGFSVGIGSLKELETLKVGVVGGDREGYS
ncbi:hypothetical protein VNO77_43982 [Canavalia gladiata]|uniref:Uncharacterized protein n=1 Tax=Canavalia gladiata TaxID=3824 RepID=A0AAN9PQJ5_CANGL